MAGLGMAPAAKALALELMQGIHEVLLLDDPIGKLTNALLTSAVLAYDVGIAPLGFAVDADVIVVLLEVYHRGARRRPREEIVLHRST